MSDEDETVFTEPLVIQNKDLVKSECKVAKHETDDTQSRNKSSSSRKSVGDRKTSVYLMKSDARQWISRKIHTKIKTGNETIEEPTKAFGVIDFKGSSKKAKAKFVQLSDTTPADVVLDMLTGCFGLPKPRILVSITGGAKIFSLNDDTKDYLLDGLRKMTDGLPGTWVFTGGTNTGIMKLVGENLHGICHSLIGIASWGVIANAEKLCGDENEIPLGGTFPYEVESSITEKDLTYLEQNHTHFLLADNGTKGQYGVEIKLVSQLIKYIIRHNAPKVPAVMILINGGMYSIENVHKAITSELPIPVVVLKGSGRAADVLSYAIKNKEGLDSHDHLELKNMIEKKMNITDKESVENVLSHVKDCISSSHMITIADPEDEESIDKKILTTILSSYKLPHDWKLLCSVLWDRVDVAHSLILEEFSKWQKPDLEKAMTLSLALNRFKIVEYFVEQNIPLHKMVTKSYLELLYGYRWAQRRSTVIQNSVSIQLPSTVKKTLQLQDNFDLLNLALGCYKENGTRKIVPYEEIFRFIQSLCKEMRLAGKENFVTPLEEWEGVEYCVHGYRDIFLWAVLNNMQDMAKVLWKLGDEQIAKAIVAAHINNKLASQASHFNLPVDIVNTFESNAREFEALALKVLDTCYSEDIEKTHQMLTMELEEFESHNCLSLAHSSYFEQFIAHTAVQKILQELWLGEREFENHLIQPKNRGKEYSSIYHNYNSSASNRRSTFFQSEEDISKPLNPKGQDNPSYNSFPSQEEMPPHKENRFQKVSLFNKAVGNFFKSLISYCIFLVLLSYIAILEKHTTKPGIVEIIVCIWVLSVAIEEIYQLVQLPAVKWRSKLREYRSSTFNIIDFCGITIFLIGFAMQFFSLLLQYGHLLYAIDAALWILRLLQYFYANKILGPYILMIGRMFIDMLYFLSILGVFLLAHGVLTVSILAPQRNILHMVKSVIHHPYFEIFGELFTDDYERETYNGIKLPFYSEPLAWICMAVFLLIANVLLLNMLIAIFGNTFEEVQEKSDEIWKYKRYDLITEYSMQLPLPPPFTVFALIWKVLCTKSKTEEISNKRLIELDIQRENIAQFQIKNVADVLRQQKTHESFQHRKFEELTVMIGELKNELKAIKKSVKGQNN